MGNPTRPNSTNWLSRASIFLTVLLLITGIYYLLEKISMAAIGQTFSEVRPIFLGLSIVTILLTFFFEGVAVAVPAFITN